MQKNKPDVQINWHINYICNFRCSYCFSKKKNKDVFAGLEDIKKIIDSFNKNDIIYLICMSGGEPFLYPNFTRLCQELTKKHIININTNLSHKDVLKFAETINPEKIKSIHCSLHIEERERLGLVKDFIKKYKILEKKGFNVFTTYILYPSLIDRFKKDHAYFKSEGIILRPKLLRGRHNIYNIFDLQIFDLRILRRIRGLFQVTYPNFYSKKQKEKIASYINQSQKEVNSIINDKDDIKKGSFPDVSFDKFFIDKIPSFKGKYCLAGKSYVRMTPTGDVYRCHGGEHYLGNLFEGTMKLLKEATKCPYNTCPCPYLGYKYTLKTK